MFVSAPFQESTANVGNVATKFVKPIPACWRQNQSKIKHNKASALHRLLHAAGKVNDQHMPKMYAVH
ncbi:hypothetical protein Trydic_g11991 [Trypoxylus dichotomus]